MNNNNRISADVNSYNGNNINNPALEPIDENRQQQRLRNNIINNNKQSEAEKFKSAEGISNLKLKNISSFF
jgi:hypothetical protein